MSLKSEYKRMMRERLWKLTLFEFLWMFITIPVWVTWYQIDTDYFESTEL